MPKHTNLDRDIILGLLDVGANVTDTAARFGVNRRNIHGLHHIVTDEGPLMIFK